jgi:cytochrome c oxidase cbb3-type subunit 3
MRPALVAVSLAALVACASIGCEREKRQFRQIPATAAGQPVSMSDLHPSGSTPPPPTKLADEKNAWDLSEGKRLFSWFNCVGCHAHGGGAIGPPLMDNKWIYGSDPANIFATIVEGRPNGMPSFRGKIPEYQVWQLVAYVRSLSGMAPSDAAPGRSDHMSLKPAEEQMPKPKPVNSGHPPQSERRP